MVKNAKQELLDVIGSNRVLCAVVQYKESQKWGEPLKLNLVNEDFILKTGYNHADWAEFLNGLDFDYEAGYGTKELFGTIWMQNGTWYTREEYDGSEWWELHSKPEIPDYLITVIYNNL